MNISFIEKVPTSSWATTPLLIKDSVSIEEVFFHETELFYEAHTQKVKKLIFKGKREPLLQTVYDILRKKAVNFFNIENFSSQCESKKTNCEIYKSVQKTFQLAKDEIGLFCKKIRLYSNFEDKRLYNLAVEIIGGQQKWLLLNSFVCSQNLKKSCDTALPREILAVKLFSQPSITRKWLWVDENKMISKISTDEVLRSLFGETSCVPVYFLPTLVTQGKTTLLQACSSEDTQFVHKSLVKLLTIFDRLLFQAKQIDRMYSPSLLTDIVQNYLSKNQNGFDSIIYDHKAIEFLNAFTINSFFYAEELLYKNFPEFRVRLNEKVGIMSEQDKEFGTHFDIGIDQNNAIFVSQKKKFFIRRQTQEEVLASYQVVWKQFKEGEKWNAELTLSDIEINQEINTHDYKELLIAFTKHSSN